MYYDWVCQCLTEDEKFEELAFFKLGVDLMVRQMELMSIKFSQIEFPYVKDIQIMKVKKVPVEDKNGEYRYRLVEPSYYEPRPITQSTYDLVNKLWVEGKDKIFNKSSLEYASSIADSIGDGRFNAHMMRSIGIHFLAELCEQLESMEDDE